MDCRRKMILDYAKWTARSATRNFGKDYVYRLLDEVAFDDVLQPNVAISVSEFNAWHRRETEALCARASDLSIGWGAKLINVYLKTAAYVGDLGSKGIRGGLHPPIDTYLWKGLRKHFKKHPNIIDNACCVNAIKDIEDYDQTYLKIIKGCNEAAGKLNWLLIEVDQLWQAADQNKATSYKACKCSPQPRDLT